MSVNCHKTVSLLALHLRLNNQLATVVQSEKCIFVIWKTFIGEPFSAPTFDLNLQGSASGTPEIGYLVEQNKD